MSTITTEADFKEFVASVQEDPLYEEPLAVSVGLRTTTWIEGVETYVTTWYPVVNNCVDVNDEGKWIAGGTAAVLSNYLGYVGDNIVIELSSAMAREAYQLFKPYHGDPAHTNVYALGRMIEILRHKPKFANHQRTIVVAFIGDLMAPAFNNPEEDPNKLLRGSDLDHRLHQLSALKVKPNEINLDGLFDREIFVTTNHGPLLVSEFTRAKLDLMAVGGELYVTGPIDKVGRMVDYVMPAPKVRFADPDRLRLGAHAAPGTTVMHEGFINFNAGTLGTAMVEGRISAGVVVGEDSDVGGSFSIMGTLSGGGEHKVAIGKRFLGGANGGTGISHGDDCIVEAGTYITAGTKVTLIKADGTSTVVKAIDLSGESGLLFRTNSVTGAVEALANTKATKLNPLLHA